MPHRHGQTFVSLLNTIKLLAVGQLLPGLECAGCEFRPRWAFMNSFFHFPLNYVHIHAPFQASELGWLSLHTTNKTQEKLVLTLGSLCAPFLSW